MKILGIDTTTKFLCMGIYDNAKVYEYTQEVGRRLSSLLAVTIERVLDALGWLPSDIDYFACGLGPGSFTGMRVGLAAIKGLSFSLNKPIVGISTLDILARNVSLNNATVAPIIDAKRNLIYCSIYKTKGGIQKRTMPYMLLSEEDFLKKLKDNSVFLGDGVSLYKEKILKEIKGATVLAQDYWYPKAGNIITLALEKIRSKELDSPFKIKPIYLYPKECQIRIKK